MCLKQTRGLRWVLPAVMGACLAVTLMVRAEDSVKAGQPMRIGVSGGLFRDVPHAIVAAMSRPFSKLMVAETGMSGELTKVNDPFDLAGQVMNNQVGLGIFTGYEFAWVQEKNPDLKPLMTLVTEEPRPQAFIITPAGSKVKTFNDLRGLKISKPHSNRPYSQIFLDRNVSALGVEQKEFFAKITVSGEASEALDDVVEGVSDAALVDNVTWEWYKKNKPGRTAKLRPAIASEKFPATVIGYYPANLDAATVKSFRQGMVHASDTEQGKQLMSLWQMKGFQEVPKDYEESLKFTLKNYPPPAAKAKKD